MQFQLTQLKSEIQILEMTSRYLESEYNKREVLNVLLPSSDPINKLFCELDEMSFDLEFFVRTLVNMSYSCFLSGNPMDCNLYWDQLELFEHQALASYAEFYWYVYTVQAALNHRDFSIPAIASTINILQSRANHLHTSINIALADLAERRSKQENSDFLTKFIFVPQFMVSDYDFELPPSIIGRLMWYLNPETALLVPGDLFQEYNLTFNHLNTAVTNISAKISAVNVHRRWLRAALFGNEHLSLVRSCEYVTSRGKGGYPCALKAFSNFALCILPFLNPYSPFFSLAPLTSFTTEKSRCYGFPRDYE